ncbi:MAG: PorT family protein [Flavobacteriales bacterium]|nr:PorT family protein [Flavobacteriales bacterium]
MGKIVARLGLWMGVMMLVAHAHAQENVTTFGIQVRPIIPSKFFNSGTEIVEEGDLELVVDPRVGYNFGMVMRRGFTRFFSLETGISLVRRNYNLSFTHRAYNETLQIKHAFVGYEVPVQGLIYVRLGDRVWMNGSAGVSFDFYPSNTFESANNQRDTLTFVFEQRTNRLNWVQVALMANYGFEFRTKKAGYFYLGATYHRPFSPIARSKSTYVLSGFPTTLETELSGSYLTLDFRYYFHEDPERKKKMK